MALCREWSAARDALCDSLQCGVHRATEVEDVRQALRGSCAELVVAVSQLDYWHDDLDAGGYVPVDGAPWPTFQLSRPPGQCASG